jgi:hypothetical protein
VIDDVSISVAETVEDVGLVVGGGETVGLSVGGTTETVSLVVAAAGDVATLAVVEAAETIALAVLPDADAVAVAIADHGETVVITVAPPTTGEAAAETWETVAKNLGAYPATLAYAAGELASITYATPGGSIVKTLNRTAGRLASIVLSGALPSGIATTKTLAYSGETLTGVAYG